MEDLYSQLELEKCFENFNASISSIQKVYSRLWKQFENSLDINNIPRRNLEELAGNLAHEIRNPLGGIANFVTLLSDEIDEKDSKKVQGIYNGIERINKVVDNFILFSKPIEPRKISCNVLDIIKSAVGSVKKHSPGDENFFRFIIDCTDSELYVRLDPQLMIQALQNILQNSVEFMPDGGKICISLGKDKSNTLRLCIVDEGLGIHDDDLQKPFTPFYSTKPDGIGLGLATAQVIIKHFEGQIYLNKNKEGGTKVIINLPLI